MAAIAFLAGFIPTREGRVDRIVDSAAGMPCKLATGAAGWFWLHGETCGNPGKYLNGILILTVAAAVTVLIWGGNYALLAIVAHGVAKVAIDRMVSICRLARVASGIKRRRGQEDQPPETDSPNVVGRHFPVPRKAYPNSEQ